MSDQRFTMDEDPTVKAGDRVNVRNQAGGFLSNDLGYTRSWVVRNVSNGMVELYGKQHQWQIGNGWFVRIEDCVVDMSNRRYDAFMGRRQS